MKKSIFSFGTLLLFSAILWSCSDSSDNNLEDDLTLVQLMEVKANALSDAVVDISKSKGFEVITVEDGENLKNGGDYRFELDITLDDIKGVYDYVQTQNEETTSTKMMAQKRFNKVDESDNFILRLPKEKAMRPWKLYMNEDEEYVNDFVITTTDYKYSFSDEGFMYLLDSEIEVEDEKAGELYVAWSITSNMTFEYKSEFAFANDYSVGVEFGLGEMATYVFSLKNGDDILFKEEVEIKKIDDTEKGELEYSIEIGNIKIVLNSESESYMIYRDGELQEGATIQVVKRNQNSDDGGIAFCRKGRDIKITFVDGEIIELSEFITDDTLELMDEIFSSMYDMKFVKHIVDKVAREVYYTNLYTDVD